jgi:hypothetical protein
MLESLQNLEIKLDSFEIRGILFQLFSAILVFCLNYEHKSERSGRVQ